MVLVGVAIFLKKNGKIREFIMMWGGCAVFKYNNFYSPSSLMFIRCIAKANSSLSSIPSLGILNIYNSYLYQVYVVFSYFVYSAIPVHIAQLPNFSKNIVGQF